MEELSRLSCCLCDFFGRVDWGESGLEEEEEEGGGGE